MNSIEALFLCTIFSISSKVTLKNSLRGLTRFTRLLSNALCSSFSKDGASSENMTEKGDGNQRRFFVKTEDGVKDVTETAGKETGDNLAAESAENSEEDHSILPQFISVLIIAVVRLSIIIGRRVYKKRLEKDKRLETGMEI